MKHVNLSTALLICCTLLQTPATAAETISHHDQLVETGDNPEICIACHDSQAGKGHHPIAIPYPPKGKEELFVPASGKIRLSNGQVVCTSCHDLQQTTRNHLVIDNHNSDPCHLCHRK